MVYWQCDVLLRQRHYWQATVRDGHVPLSAQNKKVYSNYAIGNLSTTCWKLLKLLA